MPASDLPHEASSVDTRDMPFDQYQRYRLVADVLRRAFARGGSRGARPTVLDVGGRTGLLRRFLPEHDIALVDVEPSDLPGLVLGSGSSLPFRDGAFDAVTACDTLEHVPPEHREAFARECARIGRSVVVIAGPYRQPRVEEAEALLACFLESKLDTIHRYLAEHAQHGLPDLATTEGWFRDAGFEVTSVGHGNLERWLVLMCLSLYMDRDAALRPVASRYLRFYNEALYASDVEPPHYRHALVATRGALAAIEPATLVPRAAMPPRARLDFAQLVGELTAYDRERDVFERERARLIDVNEGLAKDLAGHGASLDKLLDDARGYVHGLEELRRELASQQAQAAEMRRVFERQVHSQAHSIQDLHREIALLHRELNDRAQNLRRALSRKKPLYPHPPPPAPPPLAE